MNITDLIVELLEKGQKVEMPGIGTLDSVVRSAHHDPATRTYYPASRVIAYSTETSGESEIVKTLAERECVSEDVAKQMWLNYIDALTDKVKRTGHHNFGKLGTLTCDDKRTFGFKMAEGVVLDAGNKGEMPIEEVKIYNHDNEEDPFARFDEAEEAPAPAEPAAEETTAPEQPVAEETPAPEPAAEEATDTNEEHWDESLKQLEDLEKEKPAIDPKAAARAEKERLEAEKKAEKERIKLEKKVEEQRRFDEEQLAKHRKEAERREAEEKRKAADELRKAEKRAEEERVKAEKKAEAGRQKAEKEAEKERIKAEKKAAAMAAIAARESAKAEAAARSEAEKEAAKQAAIQAAKEAKERKEAEKEAARMEKERRKEEAIKAKEEANRAKKEAKKEAKERKQAEKEAAKQAKKNKELADKLTAQPAHESDDEGKKKSKVWLIVLIVLCLLLLAGGAYYLLSGNKTAEIPVAAKSTTHIDAGAVNAFTYNTDMINHSGREIEQQSDLVCRFMSDYISQYLADRNFSGARAPMMDRIRQYANERLEQMLGDRFAVQRLIPYNDYIYKYNEPFMKGSYARSCRGKVQGELMNYRALDDMLYRMADELGLQPDGNGRKTAAEVQQVKADEKKAIERRRQMAQNGDAPTYVYVEKGSKQGYDLIAGFYLKKSTAAKLTARLHEMGCDAYIIEVNDMYYVSMGSANNQTAAEALYKHVKSWYDGDVVIKKW